MTSARPVDDASTDRAAFVAAMVEALRVASSSDDAPAPDPASAHAALQFDYPSTVGTVPDLVALASAVRADLAARRPLAYPATPRLVANLTAGEPPACVASAGPDAAAAWDALAAVFTTALVRAGLEDREYAGVLTARLVSVPAADAVVHEPAGRAGEHQTEPDDGDDDDDGSDYETPIHPPPPVPATRGDAPPPPPAAWPAAARALADLASSARRPASRGNPGWAGLDDAIAGLSAAGACTGGGDDAALAAPIASALLLLLRDRFLARPADASSPGVWSTVWAACGALEPVPPLTPGRGEGGGGDRARLPSGLRAGLALTAAVAEGWRARSEGGGRGRGGAQAAVTGPARAALATAAAGVLMAPAAAGLACLAAAAAPASIADDADTACAALAECVWADKAAGSPRDRVVAPALLSSGAWRGAAVLSGRCAAAAHPLPPGLVALALAGAGADARLAAYLAASPGAAAWAEPDAPLGAGAADAASAGAGAVLAALGGSPDRLASALATAAGHVTPAVLGVLTPMAAAVRGNNNGGGPFTWPTTVADALAELEPALVAAVADGVASAAAKAAIEEGDGAIPAPTGGSAAFAREALRLLRAARGGDGDTTGAGKDD